MGYPVPTNLVEFCRVHGLGGTHATCVRLSLAWYLFFCLRFRIWDTFLGAVCPCLSVEVLFGWVVSVSRHVMPAVSWNQIPIDIWVNLLRKYT